MTNRCDTRLGLVLNIELNTSLLEYTFTETDHNAYDFGWKSHKHEKEFHMNFKHIVLDMDKISEEDIHYEFADYLEDHLHAYGWISVDCNDEEWTEDYEHKNFYRRAI